ncbi:lytic transglycosylase domain-containing protein [Paenibacillus gansuensis]|uniref:Lytic transglycosylase domain-containing protein n=1 Tax=Paenibacillus gansuensis TaxID=306542 RepID=A0ABW5PDA8_9BACL
MRSGTAVWTAGIGAAAVVLLAALWILFVGTSWLDRWVYPIHYKEDILVSSRNYKVDPYLIAAIIRVESNYKTDTQSAKGAVGIMQIMPDTAKWIIERADYSKYTMTQLGNRADVNIEVGAWYIRSLYDQFDNNKIAVIAAYNAGPGNVKKWLSQNRWDGTYETLDLIPFGETRHYVQRVVYYYNKYKKIYSGTPS